MDTLAKSNLAILFSLPLGGAVKVSPFDYLAWCLLRLSPIIGEDICSPLQ